LANNSESADPLSSNTLHNLLDASASALILINQQGIILFANKAVEEIFGHSTNEVINQHLNILLLPVTHKGHHAHIDDFFAQHLSRDIGDGESFTALHKHGKVI